MSTYAVLLPLGLMVALLQSPPGPPSLSGTYRVSVCKSEPCSVDSAANTVMQGYAVLFDASIESSMVPADVASVLRGMWVASRSKNACFALNGNPQTSRTYAGIVGTDLTSWSTVDAGRGAIQFQLYQSPDASHTVQATITGADLRGAGKSRGGGDGEPDPSWGDDVVVGRRVGPADLTPCVERARTIPPSIRGR